MQKIKSKIDTKVSDSIHWCFYTRWRLLTDVEFGQYSQLTRVYVSDWLWGMTW